MISACSVMVASSAARPATVNGLQKCAMAGFSNRRLTVVTIGVDADGRAAAEAKGPGMELSACVFDTLHEDARLVRGRGRDRTHAGSRLMSHSSRREWPGYILTSIAARIAFACHRAIGTQVS